MGAGTVSESRLQRLLRVVRDRDIRSGIEPDKRDLVSLLDLEDVDRQILAIAAFRMVVAGLRPGTNSDASTTPWDLPVLHKALRRALVTDPLLEMVFAAARRRYLDRATRGEDLLEHDRRLMISLACQLFNNEYVWGTDPEEDRAVEHLASQRAGKASDSQGIAELVVRSMYFPVWEVIPADFEVAIAASLGWPDFQDLFDHVNDRAEEQRIQAELGELRVNADPVTESVRAQYEESPYPRWFGSTLSEPQSLAKYLASRFRAAPAVAREPPLRVLVAGCGTGKHPIRVATGYSDVEVVATDISAASLAVAMRESRKRGIENLQFQQGDLVHLDGSQRKFDVIEAVGVLHHLADPAEGLRALVRVLRPDGYIRIGVYSRRARRDLRPFQQQAAVALAAGGQLDLRRLRREILAGALGDRPRLLQSWDFFSMSGCRDLLGPAHEVTFTPAEVAAWLDACGVIFLGYEGLPAEVIDGYRQRCPQDPDMCDLGLWEDYEISYPDTFGNLQVFWVQPRVVAR